MLQARIRWQKRKAEEEIRSWEEKEIASQKKKMKKDRENERDRDPQKNEHHEMWRHRINIQIWHTIEGGKSRWKENSTLCVCVSLIPIGPIQMSTSELHLLLTMFTILCVFSIPFRFLAMLVENLFGLIGAHIKVMVTKFNSGKQWANKMKNEKILQNATWHECVNAQY